MLSEANIIEGMGDEVVVVLGICTLLLAIFIAWMSTQVNWDTRPLTLYVFQATPTSTDQPNDPPATQSISNVSNNAPTNALSDNLSTDAPGSPSTHNHHSEVPTTTQTNINVDVTSIGSSLPTHDLPTTSPSSLEDAVSEVNGVHQRRSSIVQASSPRVDLHETENTSVLPGALLLKLKYLDERLKTVQAQPSEIISNFKRKHFQQELSEERRVRLIFNGQELKDTSCLASYNLTDNATIHCLISRSAHPPASESAHSQVPIATIGDEMELGNYMLPVFGLILGLIWFCRVTYRQYFNVMSTFALVGLSVLFLVAAFTCYTHRLVAPNQPRDYLREEAPPIRIQHINLTR